MTLIELLGADEDDATQIQEAGVPLHGRTWYTTEMANWIMKVLLKFPGVLYDPIHAASRLGLTESSFLDKRVQAVLGNEPKYEGVFASSYARWWKSRLIAKAIQVIDEADLSGPIHMVFVAAVKLVHNVDLEPSKCNWDASRHADQVCYIRGEPVKTEHSLRYYPDNRPSIMEPARISFRAIRENLFEERFVEADSSELIKTIQEAQEPDEAKNEPS